MSPDRNPDGFDHFRRAYIAGSLADAARAMPKAQARKFRAFLAGLQSAASPIDPPEPPHARRRKLEKQRSLPLEAP